MWRENNCIHLFISYILVDASGWIVGDVSFGFMGGGFGSCNIRPPHPNDPVGIDLTPSPIPAANLRIHTRRKKMTTEKALYIILQQPIRAKLYWWLLNLSFKNWEANLLLFFSHNDVIRLFVHSGMYFILPPLLYLQKKTKAICTWILNCY